MHSSFYIFPSTVPVRPLTTYLTAHRLVTGALGVQAEIPPKEISKEMEKMADAKGTISNNSLKNHFSTPFWFSFA